MEWYEIHDWNERVTWIKKDYELKIAVEHMDGSYGWTSLDEWNWLDMSDMNDMDEIGPHRCILVIWMKFDMVWMRFHFMDENIMMDEINRDNFNGYVDQIQPYQDDGQTNLWM